MAYAPDGYRSEVLPLPCEAPRERWQEWFSWAFVQAVASAAGLVPEVKPIDSNQTDMQVQTWHPLDGQVKTIGLQLKSTFTPEFVEQGKYVVHDLEAERYNRLLEPGTIPRFVVVVAVPRPPAGLVVCKPDDAALGAAAWWGQVTGEPADQKYKRIHIPTTQRLDADGLLAMLRAA